MKTITLEISTKKGETQKLRFLVIQEIPYPGINGEAGRPAWRNFGGLFKQYGNKAQGIGKNYWCYLLADNAPEIIPSDYNRQIFAGYQDYNDKTKINGGAMMLRGKSLGEMSIHFEGNPEWPVIKINGFDSPSSSEREAITSLVCPALRAFIAENAAALKDYAVKQIKARFATELKEATERLADLKQQADHEAVY